MFSDLLQAISADFMIRLLINVSFLFFLIRFSYYKNSPNRDFLFSYFLFGIGVYVIAYQLRAVELSMGFTFGLFAIFSMLRYRTEPISIKEMTYLFLVIAMALLSAVGPMNYLELIILNGFICLITLAAESNLLFPKLMQKTIYYENIENITPARREELIKDLKQRTGLDIRRASVEKIDFLKDTARIKIYYIQDDHEM